MNARAAAWAFKAGYGYPAVMYIAGTLLGAPAWVALIACLTSLSLICAMHAEIDNETV